MFERTPAGAAGVGGVIDMALPSVIRRWALRDRLSIGEMARRTGLSRSTIRKCLRQGTVQPESRVPERPSRLATCADEPAPWPRADAGRPRRQRRTLEQFHAELLALGCEGSCDRVAAVARKWRADRQRDRQSAGRGTFVRLACRPGEAFQFDWSEDRAVIAGENTKLEVAHVKLSHGRACDG